jgi:ribose/xylose/arabinose/galactoside ABC-type transport system permease subunit
LLTWQRGELHTFWRLETLQLVAVHASIIAAVAVGMTLVMISGGIDLSVGYGVSLVTVTTVLVYRAAQSHSWTVECASACAILAGVGTGATVGLCNGLVITQLRVVPFVVTLGMLGVARGLAQYLSRGEPVQFPAGSDRPDWVHWFGAVQPDPDWLVIGPAAWSVVLLALVAAVLLRYTVIGRYCFALGSSEATARLCGIPVSRTKILLYTLAGLATGWAGILQLARVGSGFYNVAAGLEVEVIAAVVIGGASLSGGEGSVAGTLSGALLLAVLYNGCSKLHVPNEFRFIVIGVIIVVVAAVNQWRQHR